MYDDEIVLIPADAIAKVQQRDADAVLAYNDPAEQDEYPEQW